MDHNVAEILIEALPYIRQFAGSTIVVKYGGHAMVDEQLKTDFARDITLLKYIGIHPVVVHGGGPQINQVMDRMGIKPQFVRGMRMTDAETMDVVEMVLGGKVNKSIVAQIAQAGGRAVGITGKDAGLVQAEKMTIYKEASGDAPPEIIDPGLVGEVTHVNPEILRTLSEKGFIPVVAPVGVGSMGETYNINADVVACRVAAALNASRLILLTDVDGVLDRNGMLLQSMDATSIRRLVQEGDISGGMIPKIEYALAALSAGVGKCHIINGTRRHSLLLELFTDKGIGTEVLL
ncbi:acetylglutamate kinase [Desulfococcaceae bacterium OttesenSCG-928-F15]|nr:acetylglutamate kinase [Desulfococcaceae bacterium OttesenSCG-928-F15]